MNKYNREGKVIELMSQIARKSKGAGLKNAIRISEVQRLSKSLDCSHEQALLFSLVVYISITESEPHYKDIAVHLGHDPFDMMQNVADMRALQKRGLIRKVRSLHNDAITGLTFYVPAEVIEDITEGTRDILKIRPITDAASLFARIHRLMKLVDEEVISHEEMHDEIVDMVHQHPQHPTVKNINKYKLVEWDTLFLLSLGAEVLDGTPVIDLDDFLRNLVEDAADRFRIKKFLMKGDHPLIKKGLVALERSFFANDRNIVLTDKAVKELFDAEFSVSMEQKHNTNNILLPGTLRKRKLFFNESESGQLNQIFSSLTSESYKRIKKELLANNLPSGIAILFYGFPGTGKTEAVCQLAHRLNKKIFKVDISQTKDMFFGESEKRVKKLFENYSEFVRTERNCPILLFNEADGILGTRKNVGSSAVDQTENAIQNILLEEMEHLEGIMIATTNLTANLDKAFERRFLYKVQFNRPGSRIRAKIWKEHIPGLKPSDANKLANMFTYSGGEIANVSRKVISGRILQKSEISIDTIIGFCEEERINGEKRRVGY